MVIILSNFIYFIFYFIQLQVTSNSNKTANMDGKNCSVYIQCKGDIMVVNIKQHKSQCKNSNITITQTAKFF